MRKTAARLKGIAFIFWHARHMLYHILLSMTFVWVSYKYLGIRQRGLFPVAILGAVIPDFEHILFFFTYGKHTEFSKYIKMYIKKHEWRILIRFVEIGHKYNTQLRYHNIYILSVWILIAFLSYRMFMAPLFIFSGAVVTHYLFDIVDDLAALGKINKNWFRWGLGNQAVGKQIWDMIDRRITKKASRK